MREQLQKYIDSGRLFVTIPEVCKMLAIITPTYYKLLAMKQTPKETRIPGLARVRISIEDIDKWMTKLGNPSREDLVLIAKQKAGLKLRSDIGLASWRPRGSTVGPGGRVKQEA